jgi:hypothetical protein
MRSSPILLAASAAFATVTALFAAPSYALTCYTIFDRNENVVYRDTIPPVDLSDPAAGRAALQRRGEYLMISDADGCPQVAFVFGSSGSATLSTDEFLNGIRSADSARAGVPAGPSRAAPATVAPRRAAPAAATK